MSSLVVITGVTAAGKSTLERELVSQGVCVPLISCTTRAPRVGERPGQDYNFVTPQDFVVGVQAGEIVAPGKTAGSHYGIELTKLNEALGSGKNAVVVVDADGVNELTQNSSIDSVVVCVDVRGPLAFSRLHSRYLKEIEGVNEKSSAFDAIVEHYTARFNGLQREVESMQAVKVDEGVIRVSGNAPIQAAVSAVAKKLDPQAPDQSVENQIHNALGRGNSMPSGNSLG